MKQFELYKVKVGLASPGIPVDLIGVDEVYVAIPSEGEEEAIVRASRLAASTVLERASSEVTWSAKLLELVSIGEVVIPSEGEAES